MRRSTYFVLVGCRHSELGRIVRRERLRWSARVQNSSTVQFNSYDVNAA